ncbi:MAG: DNA polymerase I, partial [Bacteroidales bacterium]|nr:DNA polymerase I [Bacteroidales bacterium]
DLFSTADFSFGLQNVKACLLLEQTLRPLLEEVGAEDLFVKVEVPLASVLCRMERIGVRLDTARLAAYGKELAEQIKQVESEIYEAAGEKFNIASPKQLGEILYEKLQITEKPKHTKTKQYSTAEDILQKLSHKHPIVEKVLRYRSLTKLKSTYVDALPQLIDAQTGRIHTTYNQAVTATGRLSSQNPNLQNIPIRTEMGKEIRRCFVAGSAENQLLASDYSQIELRIIAHLSGDEVMLRDFSQHKDVHTATASNVFGVKPEEVTSEMRRKAKTVNFGIIYGISAFGLADRLQIPRKEAADLIERYYANYPALRQYMEKVVNEAKEKGYVETMLRRRRYLQDINSGNAVVRAYAERNAVNAPVQGSSADMIKVAMIAIDRRMRRENLKAKMILQVHDELVFDVPQNELPAMKALVEEEMKNALPMRVPVEVEQNAADNWLDAH